MQIGHLALSGENKTGDQHARNTYADQASENRIDVEKPLFWRGIFVERPPGESRVSIRPGDYPLNMSQHQKTE